MSDGRDYLWPVELSALVEEVTSDVRHSLRNKLGSIRNAAFYVKKRLSKTEAWAADPRLESMASLLDADVANANDLLGRPDERLHGRRLVSVDVPACVQHAVESARVGSTTRIEVAVPFATTRADPAEIAVAVRCLLENAAEAMPHGGLVQVTGRIDGDQYFIDVVDEGSGIPVAERATVFSPYHTTKPGRVGMGLNVSRRIAERYGGTIMIGSAPTNGALVSLSVRLVQEAPGATDPPR